MFCFGILEKNRKSAKFGKSRHYRAPMPQRRNPRRGVDLLQGVGYPRRGEAEVPKWHPSGTPRHSKATPQHSYCSQREMFWIFVSEHLVFVHRLFRNPNK